MSAKTGTKWIGVGDFVLTDTVKRNVENVLESGSLTYGPYTRELEESWSNMHGCRYGIAVSSGTAALHVAVLALAEKYNWTMGVSEIIIPATTFVATANAVIQSGFVPVLVDVGLDGLINPNKIVAAVTDKTVAIIPVHLFGQSAEMSKIMKIAREHKLRVIEDSAEAVGAYDGTTVVGSSGDFGCFSTYIAHHIPAGSGGMMTTKDEELADIARSIVNHGRDMRYFDPTRRELASSAILFYFNRSGLNYRTTELTSAVASGLFEDVLDIIYRRREIAAMYQKLLGDVDMIVMTKERANSLHSWMMFPLLLNFCDTREEKYAFMDMLYDGGVDSRECLPLVGQPYMDKLGFEDRDYVVSAYWNRCGIYLPCHQYMTDDDVWTVASVFKKAASNFQ